MASSRIVLFAISQGFPQRLACEITALLELSRDEMSQVSLVEMRQVLVGPSSGAMTKEDGESSRSQVVGLAARLVVVLVLDKLALFHRTSLLADSSAAYRHRNIEFVVIERRKDDAIK